ncbi:MAG: hypothetical protein JXJ18_00720 [Rhodobacteraceae bacterium]|nr:hypothetical protein [Paracoccaceae bacterium]
MSGFLLRWVFAFILLAATYNPTTFNYVTWAQGAFADQMPLTLLLGLILVIGYIIYLRATLRSIGPFGMILIVALFGALTWFLLDQGWLSPDNADMNIWLGILAASLVLGIGLNWSRVRRRISGQADVDDVDA